MIFKTGFYAVSMFSELAIFEVINVIDGQDIEIGYEKEKSKLRKHINEYFSVDLLGLLLEDKRFAVYLGKP